MLDCHLREGSGLQLSTPTPSLQKLWNLSSFLSLHSRYCSICWFSRVVEGGSTAARRTGNLALAVSLSLFRTTCSKQCFWCVAAHGLLSERFFAPGLHSARAGASSSRMAGASAADADPLYVWRYAAPGARVEPTDVAEGLGVGRLLLSAVDPVMSPAWLRAVGVPH